MDFLKDPPNELKKSWFSNVKSHGSGRGEDYFLD